MNADENVYVLSYSFEFSSSLAEQGEAHTFSVLLEVIGKGKLSSLSLKCHMCRLLYTLNRITLYLTILYPAIRLAPILRKEDNLYTQQLKYVLRALLILAKLSCTLLLDSETL